MNDSKETRAIYRETGGRIERAALTYTAAGARGASGRPGSSWEPVSAEPVLRGVRRI
ncbi:hypothetical protein [Methylocystis sp.]|uniref:hypothetical protein n=1 Tax=Methylocystis sp. TaxID=1911079 RepID=UPI003DA3BE88